MIIVTGGAGLIGSTLVWALNKLGRQDIVVVDQLRDKEKWKNLVGLSFADYIDKKDFLKRIVENSWNRPIECMVHLGACSNTMEQNADYLMENNFEYTKILAKYCVKKEIRFIYASSAATYGDGSNGYLDDENQLEKLEPLNMYGYSKHLFDLWAKRRGYLDKIVGLKYFNVYGPNENHKENMRSLVFKAYHQIRDTGEIKLFKSYKPEYGDGEQQRDFLYSKDAVEMTMFFMFNQDANGIFNIGTGTEETWNDLAKAVFKAMDREPKITYVEMPEIIREKYQYYTKADISKIRKAGFKKSFYSLESAVEDYIKNYLSIGRYLK